MNVKDTSLRRLRLERLEGRWLMSADAFSWLDSDRIHDDHYSQAQFSHVQRDDARSVTRESTRQGQQDRATRNADRGPSVDSVNADRVFRQRGADDSNRLSSNQMHRNDRGPQSGSQNFDRVVIVNLFVPVSPSVDAGLRTPEPANRLTNNVVVAAPPNSSNNPVFTPATAPFVSRDLATLPQGELIVSRPSTTDLPIESAREGENQSRTPENRFSSQSDVLTDNVVVADETFDNGETFLVSIKRNDVDQFVFDTASLELSNEVPSRPSFLRQVDEAIRQSGLEQWLYDAEAIEFESAELDQLLDDLAQGSTWQSSLNLRQTGRELADHAKPASGNDWINSIGEMILMVPDSNAELVVLEVGESTSVDDTPWSAGVGLYRAFDYAGANTQLDDSIASVAVPVDAGSWNLTGPSFNQDDATTKIVQSPVLSLNASTAVGVAVGVLGVQYLRGRYRRGQNEREWQVTNVGAR
ncbi:MAG: hypothetical protein WBD20_13985 [Pirellulaceae bacterium]